MNTKHTPGPWTADADHFIRANGGETNVALDCKMALGTNVANVAGNHAPHRFPDDGRLPVQPAITANARLIAAAPELLAVARQIEWLATAGQDRDGVPYQPTASDWMRLWNQARAAIAKAEGKV